jgi:hypothetical protein
VPTFLAWGCVLFLLWRVIRDARRAGPFTVQVATAMRRLGWVIIVATALAAAAQGFALDQLLNTMLVARDHFGDVITQPIRDSGPQLFGSSASLRLPAAAPGMRIAQLFCR